MTDRSESAVIFAQGFLARFGLDCGERLLKIAAEIGLTVKEVEADSFDGALIRLTGLPMGIVAVNRMIREEGRKLFTLAHEIGHYLLPTHSSVSGPCKGSDIESWDTRLSATEVEANQFASEILMPRERLIGVLRPQPSFASIRLIAQTYGTSLTAASYRYVDLSSYRIAIVWSREGIRAWYKRSAEFARAVELGPLDQRSLAYDCSKSASISDAFEVIPASAWLYDSNLKDDALILEHSIFLPFYRAVLSLLWIRDAIEVHTDFDEEDNEPLDPDEFSLSRKRWPK